MINEMIGVVVVLAALGGAGYFGYRWFKNRKKKQEEVTSPPVPTQDMWTIGPPVVPTAMQGSTNNGFYFSSVSPVHYVYKKSTTVPSKISFNLEGAGVLSPVQGTTPHVTLYMQRTGDDWSAQGEKVNYRHYSNSLPLNGAGEYTLDVTEWHNVMGQLDQAGYDDCVANLDVVGYVFGDPAAGATGHGVILTSGELRFNLKEFV